MSPYASRLHLPRNSSSSYVYSMVLTAKCYHQNEDRHLCEHKCFFTWTEVLLEPELIIFYIFQLLKHTSSSTRSTSACFSSFFREVVLYKRFYVTANGGTKVGKGGCLIIVRLSSLQFFLSPLLMSCFSQTYSLLWPSSLNTEFLLWQW
jgi:hypothetical protein